MKNKRYTLADLFTVFVPYVSALTLVKPETLKALPRLTAAGALDSIGDALARFARFLNDAAYRLRHPENAKRFDRIKAKLAVLRTAPAPLQQTYRVPPAVVAFNLSVQRELETAPTAKYAPTYGVAHTRTVRKGSGKQRVDYRPAKNLVEGQLYWYKIAGKWTQQPHGAPATV